jgi:hypothetical protein
MSKPKEIIVVTLSGEGEIRVALNIAESKISQHALIGILEQVKLNVLDDLTVVEHTSDIKPSGKYDA